jgi:hypothetical protein
MSLTGARDLLLFPVRSGLSRRLLVFLAVSLLAVLGLTLYGYRLTLGPDLGDEASYANLVIGRLRAPRGDTGDHSPHQPSALLLEPFVRLYARFVPDFRGVILLLRCLYAGMALLSGAAVWLLLRRMLVAPAALALALIPVAFIPWGLPAPSYNTLGMLGTIAALCLSSTHLLHLWARPAQRPPLGGLLVPTAGGLFALSVLAYPTLLVSAAAFFLFAVLLAPDWKGTRPLLTLLVLGGVFLLLGGGLVVGALGDHKLTATWATASCKLPATLPPGCTAALAWCSFFTVYGQVGLCDPATLDTALTSGPFAGLRTSAEHAAGIEEIEQFLAPWQGRCHSVLILSQYTGLYLLTPLKPRTPRSWFLAEEETRGVWPRLRAFYTDPSNRPDLVVDLGDYAPLALNPVQASLLETSYRRLDLTALRDTPAQVPDGPAGARLYLPRDLPGPAVCCPFTFRLDHAPAGTGWSYLEPERGGQGHFTWMTAREATLWLPRLRAAGLVRLRIHAAFALAEDVLNSLQVCVNGRTVPLTAVPDPNGRAYEGVLPPEILACSSGGTPLQFRVNRTIAPPGGERALAIAFRRLVFTDACATTPLPRSEVP